MVGKFIKLPAGHAVPFTHWHRQNEELYLFAKGTGQFQVDGTVIPVREGTAIRVSSEGARAWRNNSTEDLYYVVVQAPAESLERRTIDDGELVSDTVHWPET